MSEEDELSVKREESQDNMKLCCNVKISRREWTSMPILLQTETSLEEKIQCLEEEFI